jgi:hypothetical protein
MIRNILSICFLVFFLSGAIVDVKADEQTPMSGTAEHLLSQANDFFRQAGETKDKKRAEELYRKALLRYESLSREITNGKLYYNIANVYFRLNDLGRAIVNYRRAEKFIADDDNLRQNLAAALAKRQDKIEPGQEDKLLHTLFFWHYDLSRSTRLLIFFPVYIIFWFLAWLYWGTKLKIPQWLPVLFLVLVLSLGASLLSEQGSQNAKGVIVSAEVIARKGDSTSYQPSFEEPLHAGTEFMLLDERASWLHIKLADGRQCWIPAYEAEMI